MSRIVRFVLTWLQGRCPHQPSEVVADVLQRDNLPTVVSWCSTCGAYAVHEDGEWERLSWHRPQPTWHVR